MIKSVIILALLLLTTNHINSQIDSVYVCDVKFSKSEFNNNHAGSGFLLKYNDKIYGITAKHVLFFAKTDRMKTISFDGELKSWTFKSIQSENQSVLAGKLINKNPDELIEMPPNGDWLIFEINSTIPKNAVIYSLRDSPLEVDEPLSFLGFPYNSSKAIHVNGTYKGTTEQDNLVLDVPKGNYGGCSGGPVLDNNGKLVGIVSMGYFNKELNKQIFEPASLNYFKKIIARN